MNGMINYLAMRYNMGAITAGDLTKRYPKLVEAIVVMASRLKNN